jgi:hypothetical protein
MRIGAMNLLPQPLNGERARVRGEKAKSFEFPKVGSWVAFTRIGTLNREP